MNGDGIPDLVFAVLRSASVSASVSVAFGTRHLDYGPPALYGTGGAVSLAMGDLNGDDALDLVVSNDAPYDTVPTSIGVLLGHGDGTFGAKTDFTVGPYPRGLAV